MLSRKFNPRGPAHVLVTDWLDRTPSLRFLGRAGNVSDRFGEKLSESFVAGVLQDLFRSEPPVFALLAPDENDTGCCYTLYVEGTIQPHWAKTLDQALSRNPHYAYCRGLGQLLPVSIFKIGGKAFETFATRHAALGARLGEIKPAALDRASDWSKAFSGAYVQTNLARMSGAS